MRTRYVGVGLLVLMLGPASTIGRAAAPDPAAPFLGKWNITLQNVNSSFAACWLDVFRKPDGQLGGQLLWRYGSVTPVKSAQVVNGELQVVRTESDPKGKPVDVTYAMKLVNGKLEGSVKNPDGSVHNFVGSPDVEKVDVAGTWNLTTMLRSREEKRSMVLKQDGDKITGTYTGDGASVPVENAKLEGNHLTFNVTWQAQLRGDARIEGDRLTGTLAPGQGTNPLTGERERKLGTEVVLFDGKELKGWHSREPKEAPPKWVVQDGYLMPLKGAADICSDQKFDDFKVHVEFYFPEKGGNSGVYPKGLNEVQCLDDAGRPTNTHSCGAIYSRIAPTKNAALPIRNWETIDITLVGRWITVVLNGEKVVDNQHVEGITGGAIVGDPNESGPIMLQAHGQAIRFRNVRVTPLLK